VSALNVARLTDAQLTDAQRESVRTAVTALESAEAPVAASGFAALSDPALRRAVAAELESAGRVLAECEPGFWLSGYCEEIADRLVAEGLGVLEEMDRAVLALVLLHTVAIPRARGRIHADDWTEAVPTDVETLKRNRHLSESEINASLRRLRTAGIIRPGHRPPIEPGPQFLRLSRGRSTRIWEELLLVAQPEGPLARLIRRRRAETVEERTT
jgi:hypothetical protein